MVLAALTLGRSKEIGKLQRTVGNTKKNKKGLGKSGNTSEVASNGKKAAGTGKNNREVNETFDYRKVNKQTNGRGETLATRKEVKQFKKKWEQLGIPVIVDKKGKVLKDGYEAAFNFGNGQILIKKNPTIVNLYHEGYHAEQWMDIGKDAYMKLSRLEREEYVFEQILKNRHLFDEASIGHSLDYIERLRNKFK
ncbi:hypothetical protein EN829_035365 [Mesorhizobium sp. M00.F.Ca.ET.186.01.1.1]|nr:hypothetical protein EN829_035365 [Mesorhizobium sp. M00.F.Ca.ET.186.01.1.1]